MFLFRAFFWLSAVILLLPASGDEPPPRVTLFEAAAALAVLGRDLGAVCDRQPIACETGERAISLFGRKLETGTKIVTDRWTGDPEDAAAGLAGSDDLARVDPGTLTSADREAPWTLSETP